MKIEVMQKMVEVTEVIVRDGLDVLAFDNDNFDDIEV
jgi:hypothetical protein